MLLSADHGDVSYSLKNSKGVPLDHLLVEIMSFKRNGVFIEVGANDGIKQSNTKLLEDFYGWSGVLVEPSEKLFSNLCNNRPHSQCFNCALGSFDEDGAIAYGDFDGHLMASLVGRLDRPDHKKVLVRSLQSVLDECGIDHINFFSLDTEGYEFNILKGIDFTKTTFDYFLIEIYNHQVDEIINLLSEHDYELVSCLSNYNKISNPCWDGTHNDYLFRRRGLESI